MNSIPSTVTPKETIIPVAPVNPEVGQAINSVLINPKTTAQVFSGLEAIIKLPLSEDKSRPLFCVSQRPHRYNSYAHDQRAYYANPRVPAKRATQLHVMTTNLFLTDLYAESPVKIIDKGNVIANDYHIMSHRTVTGSLGLVLHISSTTDARGKLRIVPYNNLTKSMRGVIPESTTPPFFGPYTGKGALNNNNFLHPSFVFQEPMTKSALMIPGSQTLDLSLNRTAVIPAVTPPPNSVPVVPEPPVGMTPQFYWRQFLNYDEFPAPYDPGNLQHALICNDFIKYCNQYYSLFPDSGIAVFMEGDLNTSSSSGGSITINIDFDYSNVRYSNYFFPLLPSIVFTSGRDPPVMDLTLTYTYPGQKATDIKGKK